MANITKKETQTLQPFERSPFSIFDRFFDDSLFEPFALSSPLFGSRRLGSIPTAFPKVDVTESDTEIKVMANIPGIDPEKLEIEVGDDYLSLAGKMEKESTDESRGKIYRYEREYGEFRREFTLPARVNKDGIVAKAKNGVLTLTLPKSEEERKNKIKVHVEN